MRKVSLTTKLARKASQVAVEGLRRKVVVGGFSFSSSSREELERDIYWSCVRKVRYRTEEDAYRLGVRGFGGKKSGGGKKHPMMVYHCRYCESYHVGHSSLPSKLISKVVAYVRGALLEHHGVDRTEVLEYISGLVKQMPGVLPDTVLEEALQHYLGDSVESVYGSEGLERIVFRGFSASHYVRRARILVDGRVNLMGEVFEILELSEDGMLLRSLKPVSLEVGLKSVLVRAEVLVGIPTGFRFVEAELDFYGKPFSEPLEVGGFLEALD